MDRLVDRSGTEAQFNAEHLDARWIVDHSRDPLAPAFDCERNAKYRIAMRKVRGAVEWIDIPLVLTAGFDACSLFPHHVMRRKLLANALQNQSLRLSVGHRD